VIEPDDAAVAARGARLRARELARVVAALDLHDSHVVAQPSAQSSHDFLQAGLHSPSFTSKQ
jgi:hypothetical protein